MSNNVRKRTFGHVRPEKIPIRLRIRAVWSESSLGAFWITKNSKSFQADNEDSNQNARMRRLIWVFAGSTCPNVHFLTLSLKLYISIFYFCFVNICWSCTSRWHVHIKPKCRYKKKWIIKKVYKFICPHWTVVTFSYITEQVISPFKMAA